MAGTARDEAERLVATVLAMAARSGLSGSVPGAWATGSAECCVCPVCRVIASLRDPHPVTAERLASGAGDFATGVASMMRAVSAIVSNPRPASPARPSAPPPNPDTAWSVATRTTDDSPKPPERSGDDVWAAATGDRGAADAGPVDHEGSGA
jgi:hypothetical protein